MPEEGRSVEVSGRIEAPAALIFAILANPQRHRQFDGSDMLRGSDISRSITGVGDTFTMKMHRLGRDYLMVNHVVEFVPDRRISWEPAPGDIDTAGGDLSKVGIPAGYRWGYVLTPDGENATVVTEIFDCGQEENRWILLREDGQWINGRNPVLESMRATLERLKRVSTQ